MSSGIKGRTCISWVLVIVTAIAGVPLFPVSSAAQTLPVPSAVLPNLPRAFLNTTYAPPGGPIITVPAGGDFQAALNAATPGSTIVLQAGATYSGNFTLPNKAGNGWIYIQSSALASLPPPGVRVTPAQASLMPKILDTTGGPAISTAAGAHNYRFVGVEITTTWATTSGEAFEVVTLSCGGDCAALGQVPNNITIDRCYVHGTPTGNVRRGISAQGASLAVIDSYIADIHDTGADAQAIASWNGPGPFKIVNNELEASGENVMFGGAPAAISNLVPSDIEIRGNHFFKPLSWRVGDPTYAGIHWSVKNLFELKNAQRVLMDGNVLEHNWADAQSGDAILFTVRGEFGVMPWAIVADVTFTHNILQHVASAFEISARDDTGASQQTQRLLIQNNLLADVGALFNAQGHNGWLTVVDQGLANYIVDHNTMFDVDMNNGLISWTSAVPSYGLTAGFIYTNNITNEAAYGFYGDNTGANAVLTLNTYYAGWIFLKNAIAGGGMSPGLGNYPAGNFFPTNMAAVGFVSYDGGMDSAGSNYALAASSPYKNAGTDGRDLGADFGALYAATANAISGGGTSSTSPPTLSVTPQGTVSFGSVTVGGTANQSFTVTNSGGGTLTGGASTGAPFGVVSGGGFSLSGGASQTVVVQFSPSVAGAAAGTVTFSSNGGTVVVALTGTGTSAVIPPALSVTPLGPVSFGSVAVGGSSNQSFTVTNSGGGTLTGTATAGAPFGVVSGGSFSVSGGASQTVVVRFSPGAPGAVSGTVTFNSNGGAVVVVLTGTGASAVAPPTLSVTPPGPVSFGSVTVGGIADQPLTVTNSGGGILTGTATTGAPFSVVSGGAFALSAGMSQTVVVRFIPSAAAAASGTVTFSSNGGSVSVAVNGTGAAAVTPTLSVTPLTSVDFGSVTQGGSADQWFTVSNSGGGNLTGTVATAAPFSIVSGSALNLSGGATQAVDARFSPSAAGSFTGSIKFTSNGGNVSVAVTGTGGTSGGGGGTSGGNGGASGGGGAASGGGGGTAGGGGGTAGGGGGAAGGGGGAAGGGGGAAGGGGGTSGGGGGASSSGGGGTPFGSSTSARVRVGSVTTQPVEWTSLVHATATGNALRRTGGPRSGGVSTQRLVSGDGYVEFTLADAEMDYVLSLGSVYTTGFVGGYALHLATGRAEAREFSWSLQANTTARKGDVFRIAVVNGRVRYMKNSTVFYTSSYPPTTYYPLMVLASLRSPGAAVSDVNLSATFALVSAPMTTAKCTPAFAPALEALVRSSFPVATRRLRQWEVGFRSPSHPSGVHGPGISDSRSGALVQRTRA